jgi:hypothetical protein
VCVEAEGEWRSPWDLYHNLLITLNFVVEERNEIGVEGDHDRWEDVSSSGIVRHGGICRVIFVSCIEQSWPRNIKLIRGQVFCGIWQI